MSEIRTLEQLAGLYPNEPTKAAITKECDRITPYYQALIETSPFLVIATARDSALDCSPRGDGPGFVDVVDEQTLVIPDRRGNNRLDTLRNIIADPRVGLIFLIPGVGECVRVRGTARISADPARLAAYSVKGKPPTSLLEITVERVFFQCARAILRSRLWEADAQVTRDELPTAGMLLEEARGFTHDEAVEYDAALADRQQGTLY